MKRWQVAGAGLLFLSAGPCGRRAAAPTWVLRLAGPEYGSLNDAVLLKLDRNGRLEALP